MLFFIQNFYSCTIPCTVTAFVQVGGLRGSFVYVVHFRIYRYVMYAVRYMKRVDSLVYVVRYNAKTETDDKLVIYGKHSYFKPTVI